MNIKAIKLLTMVFFAMFSAVSWSSAVEVDFTGKKASSYEKLPSLLPGVIEASGANAGISVSNPIDSASGESLKGFLEKSVTRIEIKSKAGVPQRKISFEEESKDKEYEPYYESINCSDSGKRWTVTDTEWYIKQHQAQDVYMCEYVITWDNWYTSCRESNPHTNPGVCTCKVNTQKKARTPTGRCEWSANE